MPLFGLPHAGQNKSFADRVWLENHGWSCPSN